MVKHTIGMLFGALWVSWLWPAGRLGFETRC